MDTTDLHLLELAGQLARAGGERILAVRRAGFAIERKADLSPVTEADRLAEAVILDGLRVTGLPIVAEEAHAAGGVTALGPTWWLVDPLDGTREFAAGRDQFAVNVGLVRDGQPVLGAVYLPATDEMFLGLVGAGAWKETAGLRRPIAARLPPAEGLTVFASRHYAADPALARVLACYTVARLVNVGSALKFCRVAEGEADLYPRLGATCEWDTAAPQAVLEAAGGRLRTWQGERLAYGKPGFENPGFLVEGARPA